MVSHWLIDSSSSALSSQHPQTLRFFLARWKISNTIDIFLKRSNPHENYPHTRETCWASCHARRLAQQVALVCGRLNITFPYPVFQIESWCKTQIWWFFLPQSTHSIKLQSERKNRKVKQQYINFMIFDNNEVNVFHWTWVDKIISFLWAQPEDKNFLQTSRVFHA